MLDIRLSPDQVEMLHKILESYLSDLRVEIADTDLVDSREALKREETFVKDLLCRLESTPLQVSDLCPDLCADVVLIPGDAE